MAGIVAAMACYSTSAADDDDLGGGDGGGPAGDEGGVPCELQPTSWTVSVLEAGAAFGTNLVVDRHGVGHATFSRWSSETAYARHEGGLWNIETAARDAYPGVGIAVDADGAVHFCAIRYTPEPVERRDVLYITNRGGSWSEERIGSSSGGLVFALAPDGTPSIGYAGLAGELVVARFADGAWSEDIVDEASEFGNNALAVDRDGARHVLYFGGVDELDVRYATDASGQWESLTLGRSEWAGVGELRTQLLTGPGGRTTAAYEAPAALHVVTLEMGTVVDEVARSFDAGEAQIVGFAFEAHDRVFHIAGVTLVDGRPVLRYATDRPGEWQWSAVAEVEEFFSPPLLVVDAASSPWILYTAIAGAEGQSVLAAVPDGPWCR